jgi:isoleucyl-tRNA synthetase
LNTLFEVLYILVRGLAPFIPFLTDKIYQHLLPHIPTSLQAEDPRSVHFLDYPDVREELFDPVVERQVSRMQKVIDLGRLSRERRATGLKTPLKSLVVIHADEVYLEDVKSLQNYILEELNIRDLILSSDDAKYNVQYSLQADWPSLGRKYKKDAQKIRKALPNVTQEEVKTFIKNKTITIDGINLGEEDVVVRRDLKSEGDAAKYLETNSDNDVITILDSQLYPELAQDGLVREIVGRVQRLRKKAGLVQTDDVRMEYQCLGDPDNIGIEECFDQNNETIHKALRGPVTKKLDSASDEGLILAEEQELQKATVLFRLLKLS